jgi:hypothetical protein
MSEPLLDTTLIHANHVRSFQVRTTAPTGWLATEEADAKLVEQHQLEDWHRVERMLDLYSRTIGELLAEGWRAVN